MYRPEDFGLFALFVSLTAILGAIAKDRNELQSCCHHQTFFVLIVISCFFSPLVFAKGKHYVHR